MQKSNFRVQIQGVMCGLLLFLFLAGCAGQGNGTDGVYATMESRKGLLSLFFQLQEDNGPKLSMDIASIEILAGNGSWQPLVPEPLTIETAELKNGQRFLGRGVLAPDNYTQVRFTINRFEMADDAEQAAPLPEQTQHVVVNLHKPLYVGEGDSQSLFFTWDTKASLEEEPARPIILVAPKLRNPTTNVAFVACPEINTVFMIRTDKNMVVDSLAMADGVSYLYSNPSVEDNVYALSERRAGIKVISPSSNRVIEQYNIPLAAESTYMALSPDGRNGYIVDEQRGDVYLMDMISGRVVQSVRLGYKPSYVLYLEKYNQVAVTLSLSQTVMLLDAQTLAEVGSIATGQRPAGLMSFDDTLLYIAESGSNSVMVYSLENSAMVGRLTVEFDPYRILKVDRTIYVTNSGSHSLSVLRSGQTSVSFRIPLSGKPGEMAYDFRNRWVYVGNEQEKAVLFIEPNTNAVAGKIELGAVPKGIEVF